MQISTNQESEGLQPEQEILVQSQELEEDLPRSAEVENHSDEELRHKYLPKHIAVMAHNEEIRPAMVVSKDGNCVAYNKYGEVLLITDSLCYQMISNSAMIPKSR